EPARHLFFPTRLAGTSNGTRLYGYPMAMTLPPPLKEKLPTPVRRRKLPIEPKIALTAFAALLVPVYLFTADYGLPNFLYICDIALLLTVVGLWLENRLLLGTQLVGILTIQTLWCIDYFGRYVLGYCPLGLSEYAFGRHWLLHFLTLFHVWLPLLLLWAVRKLGYDRRSYVLQTAFMTGMGVYCVYFSDPAWNLNWNVDCMNLTVDHVLAGRLPASLDFIYQFFHAYTEWRLSLPPELARFLA